MMARILADDQYLVEMAKHLDGCKRLPTSDGMQVIVPAEIAVLYANALRSIAERVKEKSI
jgi:hypothetical protein